MSNYDKEYDIDFLKKVIEYNSNRYFCFKNNLPFEHNSEYDKILNSRYCKVSRIKRRLVYLLSRYDHIWFCTFTFDNYYINKSDRTKRDLIKKVLNSHDFKFILNIDYGKTTEREHYHCVLGTNWNMDVNQFFQNNYECFCLAIQCKKGKNDFQRLSKYINKLTNHCIKATTKRQRLLYNFKGYDTFCPSSYEKFIAYTKDLLLLFPVKEESSDDTLLDKGVITGKI